MRERGGGGQAHVGSHMGSTAPRAQAATAGVAAAASNGGRRSTGAPTQGEPPVGEPPGVARSRRRLRALAGGVLAVQLLLLVLLSAYQFSHYDLSFDFATYAQAWWQLGHGHLDPFSSTLGAPFVANQTQLVLWPLALLEPLAPSGLTLLWVQDLALVATNALTLVWVEEVLRSRPDTAPRRRRLLAALSVTAIAASPWCYETALWAFHVEPLVGFFAVAAGLASWRGATRWLWLWVPLLLATGVIGALAAAGLGLAVVLGPGRSRVGGGITLLASLAWLLATSALGLAGGGAAMVARSLGYLHLQVGSRVAALTVLVHLAEHPAAVLSVLQARLPVVVIFLLPAGLVGIATRWGAALTLAVMVPPALLAGVINLTLATAFQVWPALPFVVVGSVMVLLGRQAPTGQLRAAGEGGPEGVLAESPRSPRSGGRPALAGRAAVLSWLTFLVALDATLARSVVQPAFLSVPAATASRLQRIRLQIPSGAEVVATQGIVGRFGMRAALTAPMYPGQEIRIDRREVVFVLGPTLGAPQVPGPLTEGFEAELGRGLGASALGSADGVAVWLWRPRRPGGLLEFPSARYEPPAEGSG